MIVKFSDGKVRKNPILYGSGWYLHWTEDDICEFVIKAFKTSTQESSRKRMVSILNKIGMPWKMVQPSRETYRSFPPFWGDSHKAFVFELDIHDEIPVSTVYELNH